jgi:hypothetical protein
MRQPQKCIADTRGQTAHYRLTLDPLLTALVSSYQAPDSPRVNGDADTINSRWQCDLVNFKLLAGVAPFRASDIKRNRPSKFAITITFLWLFSSSFHSPSPSSAACGMQCGLRMRLIDRVRKAIKSHHVALPRCAAHSGWLWVGFRHTCYTLLNGFTCCKD